MRKYDPNLVNVIREKQYVKEVNGVKTLFKPVPDDDREHAMDPRLYEIASMKKKMFANRAKGGFRLSNERYRPDKVTYDLIENEIDCDERLIPVNGTHMIDIFIYRRADIGEQVTPVMVYLHGGGFTAGDIHLFEKQMQFIAEQSGATVVFPEYRLAPETPYPGAHEDAYATVRYVYENAEELHIDREKIMVAGDSAGGLLSNACAIRDIQDGAKIIRKIFTLYPVCDNRQIDKIDDYVWSYDDYPMIPEQEEIARSRVDRIKKGFEKKGLSLYEQGFAKEGDPLLSPIQASDEILKQYPETVINNSEFDFLRIGGEQMAKKLNRLGVNVRLVTYCGCDHGILDMLGTVVQAEELCLCMADELKAM